MSRSPDKQNSDRDGKPEWSIGVADVAADQLPESPFYLERVLRTLNHRLCNEHLDLRTTPHEHIIDFVSNRFDDMYEGIIAVDKEERAQELAFQAMESKDPAVAEKLVEKALALDADCLDALTVQAFLTCDLAMDLIEQLTRIKAIGRRNLGDDFFIDPANSSWLLIEARPYLRIIKQLAEVLWETGQRLRAVEQYETLLELDPEDHLVYTHLLLACYLSLGEVGRTWELLEEYDDPADVIWQWGWVLTRFLADDIEGAGEALVQAHDLNPGVLDYLSGAEPIPDDIEPFFRSGGCSEAVVCAQVLADAWATNPSAMLWLLEMEGVVAGGEKASDKGDQIDKIDGDAETVH